MNARQRQIMALLQPSEDGLEMSELCAALGLRVDRVGELLRDLRKQGLCGPGGHGGRGVRWYAQPRCAEVREQRDAQYRRDRERKKKARQRAAQRADQTAVQAAAEARFLTVRQSVVPAAQCKPLRRLGPRSVFELAA